MVCEESGREGEERTKIHTPSEEEEEEEEASRNNSEEKTEERVEQGLIIEPHSLLSSAEEEEEEEEEEGECGMNELSPMKTCLCDSYMLNGVVLS